MKTLWFKGAYVAPILARAKTDTIRSAVKVAKGDVVALSVGPRTPFATASIVDVQPVVLADLDAQRRKDVIDALGERARSSQLHRITFEVQPA